jgi:hypothetical protein
LLISADNPARQITNYLPKPTTVDIYDNEKVVELGLSGTQPDAFEQKAKAWLENKPEA